MSILQEMSLDFLSLTGLTLGAVTVYMKDKDGLITLARGTTVPTGATTGYASGCVFIDTDVATKISGTYINVGTNTSCVFRAIGPTAIEYDTAGDILRAYGTSVPGVVAGYAKGALYIKTDVAAPTSGIYQNVGTTAAADFDLVGPLAGNVHVPMSIYIGTLGAGLADTLVHSFTMPAYASALIKAECWCSAVTDVVSVDVKEATTTLLTTAGGIALTAATKTTDTVVAAGDPVASGAVINIHATSTGGTGAASNVQLTLIFKLATY